MPRPAADLSKYSYTPRKSYTYDVTDYQATDWQPNDDIKLDNNVDAHQTDLLDVKSGRNSEWVGKDLPSMTARKTADWAELDMFQKHREQYYTGNQRLEVSAHDTVELIVAVFQFL